MCLVLDGGDNIDLIRYLVDVFWKMMCLLVCILLIKNYLIFVFN